MRIQTNEQERSVIFVDSEQDQNQRDNKSVAGYLKLVSDLVNSIECGTCNSIIYEPAGKFDPDALRASTGKHYAESPRCHPKFSNGAKLS